MLNDDILAPANMHNRTDEARCERLASASDAVRLDTADTLGLAALRTFAAMPAAKDEGPF